MYVRYTICYLSSIMYLEHIVKIRYTICYLSSIIIMGAYCVGKVHNMLPRLYYDKGSILCM